MSDAEYHGFLGLLAAGGVLLSVLAIRGLDQRLVWRVVDGLAAAGSFGYALYLAFVVTDPAASVNVYYFAVAAVLPLLLIVLLRERARARRRRLAAGLNQIMYVAPPPATALTPFPAPPPPYDPAAKEEPPPEESRRHTYEARPSGLPRKPAGPSVPGLSGHRPPPANPPAEPPPIAGPGAPLPGRETFRHTVEPQTAGHDTADVHETTSRLRRPAYLDDPAYTRERGRHRASEPDEPGEGPPDRR
ncbi:hypothetical protein [Paractinoplanes globisporus]|uniref:Integral membrane protein n=1 Tax=Paractinoplanes globisporus TaxID=113565 RepID=A0ABW6WSQ5_9ACTN|nr:hypothetical protein [Actinoplanes globisporus]